MSSTVVKKEKNEVTLKIEVDHEQFEKQFRSIKGQNTNFLFLDLEKEKHQRSKRITARCVL